MFANNPFPKKAVKTKVKIKQYLTKAKVKFPFSYSFHHRIHDTLHKLGFFLHNQQILMDLFTHTT